MLLSVNPKVCFMYSFHRSCIGRYVSNLKKKLITSFSHSKANKYDRDIPMVTSLYKVIAKDVSNYLCPSFGMSNNLSFLRSRDVRLFLLDSLGLLFFIGLLSRFCLKYSRFSISPLRSLFSGRVALKKFATKSSFTACNKEIQNCIVVYWLVGAGEINTFNRYFSPNPKFSPLPWIQNFLPHQLFLDPVVSTFSTNPKTKQNSTVWFRVSLVWPKNLDS